MGNVINYFQINSCPSLAEGGVKSGSVNKNGYQLREAIKVEVWTGRVVSKRRR